MKKGLLIVAALAATMSINAQESAYFAASLTDLTTTKSAVSAGTACGSTSLADAFVGADDSYKLVSINGPKDANEQSYRLVTIDGTELTEETYQGVQGDANPKDVSGANPATALSAPVSGAFFQFTAKGDGYLYVVGKFSSNKNYTVFEEGSAIPYQYVQATDGTKLPQVLAYDLTGTGTTTDDVEYITLEDHPNGIYWPEQIASGMTGYKGDDVANDGTAYADWVKIGQNGVGVIGFPIFKDLTYIVNACGSKLSGLGFYTSAEKAQNITLSTSDGSSVITFVKDGVLQGLDPAGINGVAADKVNALDPIYNLAGQRVSAAYKGVVIQNGQKFIQK